MAPILWPLPVPTGDAGRCAPSEDWSDRPERDGRGTFGAGELRSESLCCLLGQSLSAAVSAEKCVWPAPSPPPSKCNRCAKRNGKSHNIRFSSCKDLNKLIEAAFSHFSLPAPPVS